MNIIYSLALSDLDLHSGQVESTTETALDSFDVTKVPHLVIGCGVASNSLLQTLHFIFMV